MKIGQLVWMNQTIIIDEFSGSKEYKEHKPQFGIVVDITYCEKPTIYLQEDMKLFSVYLREIDKC